MATKRKKAGTPAAAANRPFYESAIREAISAGELAPMKSTLAQAKAVLKQQGDLKAAVAKLEKAIKKADR